jgi:hypothetical protein
VYWANSPPECPVDHTREYFCDELMPLAAGAPAPAPYENCPVQTESHTGRFPSTPPVAVFDPSYTEHTRQRAPPGHACCYSWCSRLELGNPDPAAAQAACGAPSAFREEMCFPAPERGTSQPAHPAFAACPVAIVPPRGVSFSVPESALFDERATADRQRVGISDCCYSWCSEAPPTSGLGGG